MIRTPLKRSRKPLPARSAKRDAYEYELDAITPALIERSQGRCEFWAIGVGCTAEGVHRHHKLRRSQGGQNLLDNLVLLCERHHGFIHAHPAWAIENGYLCRSWDR